MLPILYNQNSTLSDWQSNNGLGFIRSATDCYVTQEANGVYEATFAVPLKDRLAKIIQPGMVVRLLPNTTDSIQTFDITRVGYTSNNVEVTARHLRYRASGNVFSEKYKPASSMTVKQVWDDAQEYLVYTNPFTFSSTLSTTGIPIAAAEAPISFGEFLMGSEGSMLDTYKGLYKFNNYNIQMLPYSQDRNDICLRAGSGLVDVNYELTNEYIYTDVSPTATIAMVDNNSEEVGVLTVYTDPVSIGGSTLNYSRALAYDFTDRFVKSYPNFKLVTDNGYSPTSESYSEAQTKLETVCRSYINSNLTALSQVNLNMDVTTQPEIEQLKGARLGDLIGVYFEPLNLSATTRIVKTVFDVIGERYSRIECGDTKKKLSSFFSDKNFGGL